MGGRSSAVHQDDTQDVHGKPSGGPRLATKHLKAAVMSAPSEDGPAEEAYAESSMTRQRDEVVPCGPPGAGAACGESMSAELFLRHTTAVRHTVFALGVIGQ